MDILPAAYAEAGLCDVGGLTNIKSLTRVIMMANMPKPYFILNLGFIARRSINAQLGRIC
jgi:hypothetical protein